MTATTTSPTLRASLALLTDAELAAMTRRAYAGAASAWRALQRPLDRAYAPDEWRTLRMIQLDEANELDEWHAQLAAERQRRRADR